MESTGASASVLLSAVLHSLLAARSTEVQEMGQFGINKISLQSQLPQFILGAHTGKLLASSQAAVLEQRKAL